MMGFRSEQMENEAELVKKYLNKTFPQLQAIFEYAVIDLFEEDPVDPKKKYKSWISSQKLSQKEELPPALAPSDTL